MSMMSEGAFQSLSGQLAKLLTIVLSCPAKMVEPGVQGGTGDAHAVLMHQRLAEMVQSHQSQKPLRTHPVDFLEGPVHCASGHTDLVCQTINPQAVVPSMFGRELFDLIRNFVASCLPGSNWLIQSSQKLRQHHFARGKWCSHTMILPVFEACRTTRKRTARLDKCLQRRWFADPKPRLNIQKIVVYGKMRDHLQAKQKAVFRNNHVIFSVTKNQNMIGFDLSPFPKNWARGTQNHARIESALAHFLKATNRLAEGFQANLRPRQFDRARAIAKLARTQLQHLKLPFIVGGKDCINFVHTPMPMNIQMRNPICFLLNKPETAWQNA